MNEDVDAPITDIVFLTSLESCPPGYKVIKSCPCDHSAQLWENIRGDKEEERYIAYTKEYQDGSVVEEMLINDDSIRFLRPGQKVLKHTHDGESSRLLRHRDVILKKVQRSEAERAVMDITLYRKSDKPSRLYKKIGKSNGISVCIRVAPLGAKYRHLTGDTSSESTGTEHRTQDLEQRLADLTVQAQSDTRARASTSPGHFTSPAPSHPTPSGMGTGVVPSYPTPSEMGTGVVPSYPTPPGMGAGAVPSYPTPPGMGAGAVPSYPTPPGMGAGAVPSYPTPPGMGAGVVPSHHTPHPNPYYPPPPVYPNYPAVGFNTSGPGLCQPYPMYPPPSNQPSYSQGYPPQMAYPTAPPPQGPLPIPTAPQSARAGPHGFPPQTTPTYGFNF